MYDLFLLLALLAFAQQFGMTKTTLVAVKIVVVVVGRREIETLVLVLDFSQPDLKSMALEVVGDLESEMDVTSLTRAYSLVVIVVDKSPPNFVVLAQVQRKVVEVVSLLVEEALVEEMGSMGTP